MNNLCNFFLKKVGIIASAYTMIEYITLSTFTCLNIDLTVNKSMSFSDVQNMYIYL